MGFLGIDLGTSSCKTVLVNDTGTVIQQASYSYPLSTPKPFWSEQCPEDWWQALILSVRAVLHASPIEIKGIGLSGQMHGLVLLDKQGQVLRPAILWNDGRAQPECELLCQKVPSFLQEIGNYPLVGHPAPKILWVQRHEPEVWKNVKTLCLPKDYLRFRLTNELATDMSDGAGMLLMNVKERAWSPLMLEACKITENSIGRLVEGCEIGGFLSQDAAALLEIKAGIPIVGGGGDQAAAAVGAGCVKPGQTMISLGTSGVVLTTTNGYQKNQEAAINNFCHALPNTWFHMGVMLSAAGSLQWYRDTCALNIGFDELCDSAKSIGIGSDDLLFLPYLTGERTPHCDPYLRGAFIGLSRRHTQAHLTRAVLEGIGFGLYESILLMRKAGNSIKQATMTGMGTRSSVWMQMLTDIFNIDLLQNEAAEVGPALGAARLAMIGCTGANIDEVCSSNPSVKHFVPNSAVSCEYQSIMKRFQTLYPLLKGHFQEPLLNRTAQFKINTTNSLKTKRKPAKNSMLEMA